MIRFIIKSLCIVFSLLVLGCGKKELSPRDYMTWLQENRSNLIKRKEVGNFFFEVEYMPAAEMILKDIKDPEIDIKKFRKELREEQNMQCFVFKIGLIGEYDIMNYGVTGANDYSLRVKYFSFDMQNDLQLVDGKDTLCCQHHIFERTYGLTPHLTFSEGFSAINNDNEEKIFIFNDRMFGNGPIKIKFEKRLISSIPVIKL